MTKKKELSQALDALAACGEEMIKAVNALRGALADQQAPPPDPKKDPAASKPLEPESSKAYTFAEVRKAFSAKAHDGHTEQIKALIASYGADKLSAVKEEDYSRLMDDLGKIS